MAHFAELNENGVVVQVVVVSNDDLRDSDGHEVETLGIAVCNQVFGPGRRWVQTSYNGNMRKQYAGLGMKYDEEGDVFYNPVPPFPSWVLNDRFDWVSPIPMPEEMTVGKIWAWNENILDWESIDAPILPGGD